VSPFDVREIFPNKIFSRDEPRILMSGARFFSCPIPDAFGKKRKMNALSVRVNRENPDHHLWNNNGTWWCHFTVHLPDYTKTRVRRSLQTIDVLTARSRRDQLFQTLRFAGE
jgi:hypothetical protein